MTSPGSQDCIQLAVSCNYCLNVFTYAYLLVDEMVLVIHSLDCIIYDPQEMQGAERLRIKQHNQ